MTADTDAAIRFLRTAYEPDDWIAIFLKSYEAGRTAQRVGPLALFLQPRLHAWLRAMNAQRFNIYVSVNAIRPGVRARPKNAIGAVRHLFLEVDEDGAEVLARLGHSANIPSPSYILESSPNRFHVFWRVVGFTNETIECLQKHLAGEFRTDPAATACSQTTRLPGYRNHKYVPPHYVTVRYQMTDRRHGPSDFRRHPKRTADLHRGVAPSVPPDPLVSSSGHAGIWPESNPRSLASMETCIPSACAVESCGGSHSATMMPLQS